MRDLAADVLHRYDIDATRLTPLADGRNTTFQVDVKKGERFALRIGPVPHLDRFHLQTELAWLHRLAKDPSISAVIPRRNKRGRFVTTVKHAETRGKRRCILFEWLPGSPVGENATPLDYGMLGELAAHLHTNASTWRRRRGLQPLVWDQVFYYPGEPPVLYDGRFRHVMTSDRVEVIRQIEARASAELTRIHKELPLTLLHGDLHLDNVHLSDGQLHVFDFEEVLLGAPVQDIAITLWHARLHPDYERFLDAFVEAYRSEREWPVEYAGQVNLLMSARDVMLINYALRSGVDAEPLMATAIEQMTSVLET